MFGKTLAALLLWGSALLAQDTALNRQEYPLDFLSMNRSSKDYRLGPGDLIEIVVFGVKDFDQVLRVSSSGKITLPFLGKVEVAGLTGEQLEKLLAERMAGEKLVLDPQVSVFVKEYRSQPVYV